VSPEGPTKLSQAKQIWFDPLWLLCQAAKQVAPFAIMDADATFVAGAATPTVFPLRSIPGGADQVDSEFIEYDAYAFQTEPPEVVTVRDS